MNGYEPSTLATWLHRYMDPSYRIELYFLVPQTRVMTTILTRTYLMINKLFHLIVHHREA